MSVVLRQEINLLTKDYSVIVASDTSELIQIDTTQYVNPTYYFEVVFDSSGTGVGNATLRRKGTTTDDATATSSAGSRVRTTAFTPPVGQTEYFVHINRTSGAIGVRSARIIIIDNPTTLTSTETQIEIGMNKTGLTSTTATKVVPDTTLTKYWKYTAANWDGTNTFYAEVTYLMASSKSSGTFVLQEDDGSFGTWTDKITIVNAGVASAATRVRSASFVPTDGRNYRIAYLVASSKSAASIFNAKIIVDQSRMQDNNITLSIVNSLAVEGGTAGSGQLDQAFGQSFTTVNAYSVDHIALAMFKTGTPTDNLTLTLLSGSITGTVIATSNTVSGSGLTTSPTFTNFTFSSPPALSAGTKYYMTLTRSGAFDSTNFYLCSKTTTSVYSTGGSYIESNTVWTSESTTDDAGFEIFDTSSLTLLEPQYLLLNTADNNVAGVQSYQTLYDSTEWSGVTNTYKHAMDSDNALNAAKIEDTTTTTILTTSAVTGANQQISSDMASQLVSTDALDTDIVTSTGVIAASRILVAVTVNLTINVSDSTTTSESVTVTVVSGNTNPQVNFSDSITVTESASSQLNSDIGAISDTITVTENIISVLVYLPQPTDSITVTELVTLTLNNPVSASDSVNVSESVIVFEPVLTINSLSDSITVTELVIPQLISNVNVFDNITLTESIGLDIPFLVNISDSIQVTESVGLLPVNLVNVSDSLTVTENIVLGGVPNPNISDSIAITEAISVLITSFINVPDSVTVTENPLVTLLAVIGLNVNFSDSITVTESASCLETNFVTVTDSITVTENLILSIIPNLTVSDLITISENINSQIQISLNVSDSLVISESVTSALIQTPNVSDSIQVLESINLLNIALGTVSSTDLVFVSESINLSLLGQASDDYLGLLGVGS